MKSQANTAFEAIALTAMATNNFQVMMAVKGMLQNEAATHAAASAKNGNDYNFASSKILYSLANDLGKAVDILLKD